MATEVIMPKVDMVGDGHLVEWLKKEEHVMETSCHHH
jgi:hypothetical protein